MKDFIYHKRMNIIPDLVSLKKEKVLLVDSTFDEIISDSNKLLELLDSMPMYLEESNRDLFLSIIRRIIVISETEIKFILVNGIHLTENIERTVR